MKLIAVVLSCFCFWNCQQSGSNTIQKQPPVIISTNVADTISYEQLKKEISVKRNQFADCIIDLNDSVQNELKDFWINTICNDLYNRWQNTPWDFNGITTKPQEGTVACGYFVTTILKDMDLSINRVKLSTCASSQMMKSLAPGQPLKNLSYLDYESFNNKLKEFGKGVYIIGLDFHTGFIVNDGAENWFIHSNYIRRKGVTKETIFSSDALRSSKTRWLISLTNDKGFLQRWLKG